MDHLENAHETHMTGRRVGAYQLEEEVGRGGMGVVYRASRVDGEFDQVVAVKLIKRGMDTDLILKRFRRERQITATLNHPNIAYFLGGGSTEDGLPYFVMEFIVGRPLYQYCDDNRLTIKERIAVFQGICWAVAAAHDIRIIHRDLKPSNIMVTDEGKPKLLDFGIAKILDPDMMETDGEPTATQQRVMTPEYASPEQLGGGKVDVASDIYSLGIILYELLTGHRAYELRRNASEDLVLSVVDEPRTAPSESISREGMILPIYEERADKLEAIVHGRKSTVESLRLELRGDLDRIVLKCIRPDPRERYESVQHLTDDLSRFLDGEPVEAEVFEIDDPAYPSAPPRTSLAILPFRALGGHHTSDTGENFFGVGFADSLISRLSGVGRLIVRPTTSVLQFADTDPLEAARLLGVDFVIDGTIRQSAERLRVSVQLLDVNGARTTWAKSFDQDLKDLFDLEDKISELVAGFLVPELTGDEKSRLERRNTDKPAAYRAYLRGRYFWSRFTDAHLVKAVEAFNEAIAYDPDYPLPYIGLADFYIWSAIFGEIPTAEGFPKAQEALRHALQIDPYLGEAYAVLAFTVLFYDWNWAEAERLVKQALELNPNSSFAHECYSNVLSSQGRFDESVEAIKRAEELDPVSPKAILMTSWTLYMVRRFDESIAAARKGAAMQHEFAQGDLHVGNALIEIGELDEAVTLLRAAAETWSRSGMPRYMLAFARSRQSKTEAVETIIQKLHQTADERHMKPYFIGMAYVAAGNFDKAFEWFEKALEQRNEWLVWFAVEPKLDAVRGDARYRRILELTNNPIAKRVAAGGVQEEEHSIAVLPFRNVGNTETDNAGSEEYLRLGIADSITMRLSNIRRFLVRPTSSVLPFVDGQVDPFAAGRKLGVEYVVDGIIRKTGGEIKVTAQLLNVADGSTVWSASFSESSEDVLDLEDSISEQVTVQLIPKLTGEERLGLIKRGTALNKAHDFYLQGRYFWNQFSPEGFPKALAAFEKAIEIDPEYALAHVGVADYYTWACIYGFIPPTRGFPKVYEYASRALAIDPLLAEAHAAIGLYYSNMQQWERCEECYRRAIEISPNYALGHEWLSALLVGTGRFDEGTTEIVTAERLDPISLRPKTLSAWHFYQIRNYDEALAKAEEIFFLDPDFMQASLQLSNILIQLGQNERALLAARRAVELSRGSCLPLYNLCSALAVNGETDELLGVIDHMTERAAREYVPPYFLAMAHFAAGNLSDAFDLFAKAQEEKSAWMLWFGTEPLLDRVRDDERYRSILRKTNNPIGLTPRN